MENLRWILLIAGLAVLALVYWSSRRRSNDSAERRDALEDEFDEARFGSAGGQDQFPAKLAGQRREPKLSVDDLDDPLFAPTPPLRLNEEQTAEAARPLPPVAPIWDTAEQARADSESDDDERDAPNMPVGWMGQATAGQSDESREPGVEIDEQHIEEIDYANAPVRSDAEQQWPGNDAAHEDDVMREHISRFEDEMQPNEPISELARRLQSQATLQAVEDDERFAEQALGDLGEGDNEPAPSWRHLQAEADNRETPAALEGEGEQDADDDVPPPIKFNMVDDRDVEEMPLALAEQITASREKKRKPGDAEPEANTLPEDSEQVFVEQPEAEHDATSFDAEPQSIGNIEEKLIVLHVLAMHEGVFFGAHMQQLFAERGYEHGEMNIFHSRYEKQTVFSIANLVEPGYFDPQRMDVFTTPGITLFMRLPGPLPADVAFDVLVSEAREIARELGGEVQDAEHSTLTRQRIQSLREEVLDYIHRNRLASPGQHR